MQGALAGLIGCVFGVLGILATGLIFVPLAALCALVGLFRGITGKSAAGVATSILAGVLSIIGFAVSPSLWITTGLVGLGLLTLPHTTTTSVSVLQAPPQPPASTVATTVVPTRPPDTVCLHEDATNVVFQRKFVRLSERGRASYYNAVVSGRIEQAGSYRFIKAVTFTFFRPATACQVAYQIALDGASGRIDGVTLGPNVFAHLIAASFGGSGNSYTHLLVGETTNGPATISPSGLAHSNMGGLFVGNISDAIGPGVIVWDALWSSGAHYSPHQSSVRLYPWSGTNFLEPKRFVTTQAIDPEPNALPRLMGWNATDQTGPDEFGRVQP